MTGAWKDRDDQGRLTWWAWVVIALPSVILLGVIYVVARFYGLR